MISRRKFLMMGLATGVATVVATRSQALRQAMAAQGLAGVVNQVPLAGTAIQQFVTPLPNLLDDLTAIVDDGSMIQLTMKEFTTQVLPANTVLPGGLPYQGTTVWGYLTDKQVENNSKATYLGPIIVAKRDHPSLIRFVNDLGTTVPGQSNSSKLLAYTQSTDLTLHWADPLGEEANLCNKAYMEDPMAAPQGDCAGHYLGPIPAAVHLHGGEVPPGLDGGPDAWFTSDGKHRGHGLHTYGMGVVSADNSQVYNYPNCQEAAPIWFHDHTLGATRLNVYAGLAGGYIITDPKNPPAGDLGDPTTIIPLIIQDRMFDAKGELYFPAGVPFTPAPGHPYWVPEFVGDVICVNGVAWPNLDVEQARYRFLFLNGSNARAYEMFLTDNITKVDGPAMYQIATDGGYLDTAVKIDPLAPKGQLQRLVIMPGERADVVIDFSKLPVGTTLVLRNVAKTPYPNGASPSGKTTGRIMQFRVVVKADAPKLSYDPVATPQVRATPMVRLAQAGAPAVATQQTRQLTLNEVMAMPITVDGVAYPGGPMEVLVNNTRYGGESIRKFLYTNPDKDFKQIDTRIKALYSEIAVEGETEQWEIINMTADAHPMHLHLVQFQVLNRQAFDVGKYNLAYNLAFPIIENGNVLAVGGVYNPAFGPPGAYDQPNTDGAVGGNPPVSRYLKGPIMPPPANEAGWKDTVQAYPGQVTRILVRFAPTDIPASTPAEEAHFPFDPEGKDSLGYPGGYVWHCHIIDHEDNEMMRPMAVKANKKGIANRTVTNY